MLEAHHGAFCRPPFAESQLNVLLPLVWKALAVKVVPAGEMLMATPGDCLKPVSVVEAVELVYAALAANYASSAVARLRRSDEARALKP